MNIGIEKKVDVDVFRQRIPQGIVDEFTMRALPHNFLYKLEQGYDFYLQGFYFAHPAIVPANGAVAKSVQLMVEFVRNIRSRPLQNDRYPCRLVSTPGGNGVAPTIAAGTRYDFIRYNEPYVFSEVIQARFSWQTTPSIELPVEVFMFGYKSPEGSLQMWE